MTEQRRNFFRKAVWVHESYFMHDLCVEVYFEPFKKTFYSFLLVIDYKCRCFKILNENYLEYTEKRQICIMKHKNDNCFNIKKFDQSYLSAISKPLPFLI